MINEPYREFVAVLLASAAAAILMICLVPAVSFSQGTEIVPDNDLFATTTLERHLRRQFNLTSSDVKRIHPLIKRENEKIVLTLGHYEEAESENFLSLWDGIRSSRQEFEMGLGGDLTSRQRNALRAARSEFELRILTQWTGDYLASLADFLDLDNFQINCVRKIFENESNKRQRLIAAGSSQDPSWQKLTDERERALAAILTASQVREYRSRNRPAERLLA